MRLILFRASRSVKIRIVDFNQLIRDRQPRWERLGLLLDKIDRHGLSGLTPSQADELFSLYRLVSSDLNLVQTRTGNAALLESLEQLVARAYANLAVPRRARFFGSWWQMIRHYFPATIRTEKRLLGWAALAMCGGFLFGGLVVYIDRSYADILVGPFLHLLENPSQRVAELEAQQRMGGSVAGEAGHHLAFSTALAHNNIRVSILAFALGLTFGILTIVMLFFNATILGCAAALYWEDGQIVFLTAWLGPHGVIELPCIAFAGTAGLMLARAQFRRDNGSTLSQIRAMRPQLVDIIVGTATLLLVAALIEGGFSQIHEPALPYPFKIAVAVALFTALVGYLFFMPVKPRISEDVDKLELDLRALASQ